MNDGNNPLKQTKNTKDIVEMFRVWERCKLFLPEHNFSSFVPTILKIETFDNPSILLENPNLFTHIYCQLVSIKDPYNNI